MDQEYKVVNDTAYHLNTPDDLIAVMERCRKDRTRVRITYGDVATGTPWDSYALDVGRIGRSTGSRKIPILVHNARSMGGGGILTDCILQVRESRGGKVLYKRA